MTVNQAFFAMAGLAVTLFGLAMAFFKYYIDAKIDPVAAEVSQLVQYMILHEGKIATLEERTKRLGS
jgi:hypothetical protein